MNRSKECLVGGFYKVGNRIIKLIALVTIWFKSSVNYYQYLTLTNTLLYLKDSKYSIWQNKKRKRNTTLERVYWPRRGELSLYKNYFITRFFKYKEISLKN